MNQTAINICKKYNIELTEYWTGSMYFTKRNPKNKRDYLEIRVSNHHSINSCDYDIFAFAESDRMKTICVRIVVLLFGFKIKGKTANKIYQSYITDNKNDTNRIRIYDYKYIN